MTSPVRQPRRTTRVEPRLLPAVLKRNAEETFRLHSMELKINTLIEDLKKQEEISRERYDLYDRTVQSW